MNERFTVLPATLPRVLVMMSNHHLGNFVVSIPVIRALAAYFREPIDLLVDGCHASLAERIPGVGRVIVFSHTKKDRSSLATGLHFLRLGASLRRNRYDAVIDVGGGIHPVTLATVSGARRRVGFVESRRSRLYTDRISTGPQEHVFDRYSQMLKCIGQSGRPPLVRLMPGSESVRRLEEALEPAGWNGARLAVMHPGAGYAFRRWPGERFAQVADRLARKAGLKTCLVGAPGEEAFLQEIRVAMPNPADAMVFVKPLDVLLALFDRAAILLSNESGPTHLAAATDVPIVTIFGPSKESRWRPIRPDHVTILRGADCPPECRWGRCVADLKCVMNVQVDDLLKAAGKYLGIDLTA
jgi:ADP-heptose:LPS heptosyltransferase